MGLFDSLIRSLRRQPSVAGVWLRDHLARIAPFDGSPAPDGPRLDALMDELDGWMLELYRNRTPDLWQPTLDAWKRVSRGEAMAAVVARFSDLRWAHAESSRRFDSSGGERGLGIAYLHDELVRAGLISGPRLVQTELKPI